MAQPLWAPRTAVYVLGSLFFPQQFILENFEHATKLSERTACTHHLHFTTNKLRVLSRIYPSIQPSARVFIFFFFRCIVK